jgi:hypothetical protein
VDVSRFAHVMQSEWHDMVANEGTAAAPPLIVTADDDSELPCPACGTAAPLVAGACSDCGLQLE